MVWTIRVEYDVRAIIFVGVDISRLLLRVYVIVPAFVSIIIIIVVYIFVIFSIDVVLFSLVVVWLGVREFMLRSIK